MKKKRVTIISGVIILPIAAMALMGIVFLGYSKSPINSENISTVVVDIPTGSSFLRVTKILSREGLVKSRLLFYGLAVMKGATRTIRAGEYEFSTALSPSGLIDKLVRGETRHYRVTILEDWSVQQIAAHLKDQKLIHEEDFFDLARDKDFLSSQGIFADSVEGYLFPDTYFFNRSMSTRQIMRMMIDRFWTKIPPDMINKAAEKGLNPHELVTFASLVGKEAGNASEKPMIAAVFYNRMKKGMPLQSDPTTVYDLKDFNGKILRSHYKRESPYNTYLIRGLPPGPISNPGLDSFRAVLNPAEVDFLYFVAQGDGTHFFTATLDDHNKAVLNLRSATSADVKNENGIDSKTTSTGRNGNGIEKNNERGKFR